jgi:hypothetical protein
VPYTVGSAFLVAIQPHMACIIWKKSALDMTSQSFGFFEIGARGTIELSGISKELMKPYLAIDCRQ